MIDFAADKAYYSVDGEEPLSRNYNSQFNTDDPFFVGTYSNNGVDSGNYFNGTIDNLKYSSGNIGVNFNFYDEKTEESIYVNITNIEFGDYQTSYENVNTSTVFVLPTNTYDYNIRYSANGYPQRNLYQKDATFPSSTDVSLYLLKLVDGVYSYFKVVDSYDNPLSNVYSEAYLDSALIESELTDATGSATFFLNPDDTYNFIFKKTGYGTETYSVRPTSSEPITITMSTEATANQTGVSGLNYEYAPASYGLQNNTLYNFSINFTSSNYNITTCAYNLYNGSNLLSSTTGTIDNAVEPNLCNATKEYNTGEHDYITAILVTTLEGTYYANYSVDYAVKYEYQGEFSFKTFLDDISDFSGSGFDGFSRALVAIVIIIIIVGNISSYGNIFKEPETIIILVLCLVWLMSYVGWLTMNFGGIPDLPTLKQYLIFYLCLMAGLGFIINRGKA